MLTPTRCNITSHNCSLKNPQTHSTPASARYTTLQTNKSSKNRLRTSNLTASQQSIMPGVTYIHHVTSTRSFFTRKPDSSSYTGAKRNSRLISHTLPDLLPSLPYLARRVLHHVRLGSSKTLDCEPICSVPKTGRCIRLCPRPGAGERDREARDQHTNKSTATAATGTRTLEFSWCV